MNRCAGAGLCAATVVIAACAQPSQFERDLSAQQWSDAALVFATDTALRHDERALYRAGILFGTPGRPTYDAPKARELLAALLTQFPSSEHRDDANARMLLLGEIIRIQRDSARAERDLEARISTLTRESQALKTRADSSVAASDSLRGVITRMDAERREREAQLQVLRRELQRLKEIDLKPRPPAKPQ
jgi:Trp operon repressor